MRLGAVLLGGCATLVGLLATWWAAGSGETDPRLLSLALASCAAGLLGSRLASPGRGRPGALLFLAAAVGLGLGIGEHALIPGTLFLVAAALALLTHRG